MSIPEFFHFIKPTLEIHKDGKPLSLTHVEATLAQEFGITQEARNELLPSGRSTRLYSRVQWASTYLRQAKLLCSVGRGVNEITQRGTDYLQTSPEIIKPSDLLAFPEFVAFQKREGSELNGTAGPSGTAIADDVTAAAEKATPEEAIDAAYKALKDALAQEI